MPKRSRPRAVKLVLRVAAAVAFLHLASALTLDRAVQYKEIRYSSRRLSPELEGYRVAFVTDVHNYPQRKFEAVAEELGRRKPDLVILGGDFSLPGLERYLDILAGIGAPDGIYGAPGNHDDARLLAAAMERRGMTLLRNEGVRVREGLWLAGLEDLWTGAPDIGKALEGAPADDFVLVCCHNPDCGMELDFSRADLTLSGHVHGGEVAFFGLWAPAMPLVSGYGQRFREGMGSTAAGTDVLVSRGVGSHSPMRAFCRPQALVLTLNGE